MPNKINTKGKRERKSRFLRLFPADKQDPLCTTLDFHSPREQKHELEISLMKFENVAFGFSPALAAWDGDS